MSASGTDLHVGEICWQVRIRLGIRLPDHDRRGPIGSRPVAELAIPVVSPCVGVSVAAHRQGETIVAVSSSADLAESDALAGLVWRNDGGGFPAQLAALVGADAPLVVLAFGPLGGEGEVLVDGLAEVVGDAAGEPSVEQEAFARRVGCGPLHPAQRVGHLLRVRFRASSVRVEADRVCGSLLVVSGHGLVDRVVEASGEGLAVLPAGDGDDGWTRLACRDFRLPDAAGLAEFERLAVQAG